MNHQSLLKQNRFRVLVLAAGGSGMNVLAQHFLKCEYIVFGMDRDFDKGAKIRIKNCLQAMGFRVMKETDCIRELSLDLVVTSPAIEKTHPVLVQAAEKGVPVKTRNEYIASIFNQGESIGITGTSGKTTVTGMTATILNHDLEYYNVFCGDEILHLSSSKRLGNYVKGRNPDLILEIDESDRSLPFYKPSLACITSLEKDHMSLEELTSYFRGFAETSRRIVYNRDSDKLIPIMNDFKSRGVSISFKDRNADYFAEFRGFSENKMLYTLNGRQGRLSIAGKYNVINAALSCAVACEKGIPLEKAMLFLEDFKGIRNRFELKKSGHSNFVLDFAHNPEKVGCSLLSAQEFGLPVVYVFQPHGYGPMKFMWNEFAECFKKKLRPQDRLIMLKIYDAGGTADRSVSAVDFVKELRMENCLYLDSHAEVKDYYKSMRNEKLTWVVSGARDERLRDLNASMVHESRKV